MTANPDLFGSVIVDGTVPRQHTQCKVIVFSHVDDNELQGKIDLSRDVIQCDTSKTIKGGGQASFLLVPRLNYLNYLFPNDYVYIYFDPGDGRGFVRTFFGFIDRVGRTISTDSDGRTTTRFQVACSDFTKAFDKTNLYFNPYISNREDLLAEFAGTANLGGYALRNKGLAMYGSPADFVMSILELTCGFGGQFVLPKSLTRSLQGGLIDANRKKRVEWARSRLSETVRNALIASASDLEKRINEEAKRQAQAQTEMGQEPTEEQIDAERDKITANLGLPKRFWNTQEWRSVRTVEAAAGASAPYHLLDLIDFRFIEWQAIDGFCTSVSVTWEEGSLWSIANAYSNDFLNELFCDLRPMEPEVSSGSASGGANSKKEKETSEAGYTTSRDEIGENTGGAVRFSPCVVMREYPFSTIEGISPPSTVKVLQKQVGLVYFGAIFSKEPNKPGRKTVQIPALHPEVFLKSKGKQTATKHLDVHVISIQDIVQENIGRSDADHFNLLEIYCDVTSGQIQHSRFLTQEIQPITQAIGVARHGIRVRKHNSKFGRFGMFAARAGVVDSDVNRRVLVRWALMVDLWYQHNIEYLSGTITTRAFPEIRVGCRLDIRERRESYYVEGVNHSWTYPQALTTTLTLSRGQRNDPFPVYIYPQRKGFQGVRNDKGRLAQYFMQMDPAAVARASVFPFGQESKIRTEANYVDDPNQTKSKQTWAKNQQGYLSADHMGTNDEDRIATAKELEEYLDYKKKSDARIAALLSYNPKLITFDPTEIVDEPGSTSGGKLDW